MEKAFKTVFFISALVFCFLVVGVFLLILKLSLLFTPELHIFGMTIT